MPASCSTSLVFFDQQILPCRGCTQEVRPTTALLRACARPMPLPPMHGRRRCHLELHHVLSAKATSPAGGGSIWMPRRPHLITRPPPLPTLRTRPQAVRPDARVSKRRRRPHLPSTAAAARPKASTPRSPTGARAPWPVSSHPSKRRLMPRRSTRWRCRPLHHALTHPPLSLGALS